MKQTKITSRVLLVSDVLSTRSFEVPWHQRYYDWEVDQVNDLLIDLDSAVNSDRVCYFLGSIMLVEVSAGGEVFRANDLNTLYRINDGQQRLITLSLLIAALCRCFARKRPHDKHRENLALRSLFLLDEYQTSQLNDATNYQPRIKPPKSDRVSFNHIIRGYNIGSNGRLVKAWKEVVQFVEAMGKRKREKFFDFLTQKVELSVLDIPNDIDTHSVFEALNARGKPLDEVDLIRNYLYSYFSDIEQITHLDIVRDTLKRIKTVLHRKKNRTEDYYRCFLQCRYGYLAKSRLYRETRANVEKETMNLKKRSNRVFTIVTDLGRIENLELYRTIVSSKPSENLVNNLPSISKKRNLEVLLSELMQYTVAHPVVFALLHRYYLASDCKDRPKIEKVVMRSLSNLTSFVMRVAFIVRSFPHTKFDSPFASIANNLFNGKCINSLDILKNLKAIDEWNVCNDFNFIKKVTEVEFRTNTKALNYLFGINAQNQRGSDALLKEACSVEHILPKSLKHSTSWSGFENSNIEELTYRTGNIVVVTKRENRSDDEYNRSFSNKKPVLKESALLMARQIVTEYSDWNPEVIQQRSKKLANDAAIVWSFS